MKLTLAAALDGLKPLGRRLLAPACIFAAIFALQFLAGLFPHLVERYYTRTLYPHVLAFMSLPGRLAGVSVAELFLLLLLASILVWSVWKTLAILRRRQSTRHVLAASLVRLVWMSSIIVALFMLVYGFNYQRPLLTETMRLEKREPDAQEIETISRMIIEGVNQNYAASGAAATAEQGSRLPLTRQQLFIVLEESFDRETLLQGLSVSGARVPPKPLYFSGLMSRLGLSGVYSPFTGEPNFNAIQPDADLPFTVAHELAHQRGFARESEASFVAFLVCTKSTHPYVRYSGYLNALRVLSALRRLAPDRYATVAALLGEGPRADLRAAAQFWSRYAGGLSGLSRRVNNAYLKANRVRSGVKNYGEVVSLIVAYYLSRGPAPVADSAARSYP